VLRDDDGACGDEAAGGGAGGFHQELPEMRLLWGVGMGCRGNGACGFGRADGFVAGSLMEKSEDGLFEEFVLGGGLWERQVSEQNFT
jgi:hypothetical protein